MKNPSSGPNIFPSWFSHSAAARALACTYGAVLWCRNFLYDRFPSLSQRASRPVISIGGIRMGGTGKTPVALMVGKYLLSKHCGVAFLSRGYGRKDAGLHIVKPGEEFPWGLTGDEPWLLHHRLPESWLGIHPDRRRSARTLTPALPGRSVFILDDGFQHRALKRDLDIVCLHELPFGDLLVPAGNLREGSASLNRAHIALFIGQPDNQAALENQCTELERRFPRLKAFAMVQETGRWVNADDGQTADTLPLSAPVLVCGIARPERFIRMVRNAGIVPVKTLVFADHHRYNANDFDKTRELYSNGVITTEKDAVRLKNSGTVSDVALWYLEIALRFQNKTMENDFYLLIDTIIP
jgi:tetraacyldisaccharide 4'-kinase